MLQFRDKTYSTRIPAQAVNADRTRELVIEGTRANYWSMVKRRPDRFVKHCGTLARQLTKMHGERLFVINN